MEGLVWGMFIGAAVVLVGLQLRRRARAPQSQIPTGADIYLVADQLFGFYQSSAHPEDMLRHELFKLGANLLRDSETDLRPYIQGDNAIIACMALEAVGLRPGKEKLPELLLPALNTLLPYSRFFALRALRRGVPADQSVIGPLLLSLDATWSNHPNPMFIRDFISQRLSGGENPSFGGNLEDLTGEQAEWLQGFLTQIGGNLAAPFLKELQSWRQTRSDKAFLNAIGLFWEGAGQSQTVIEHPDLTQNVAAVESLLGRDPARSVLIVGENGVGKTAMVKSLAKKLGERGWSIFEAGHADLLAGQIFQGQLEERLRKLFHELSGKRPIVWYIPDFHLLSWTGRSYASPVAVLDSLLPFVERREIKVIGELTPAGHERLIQSHPRCVTAFEAIRIEPMDSPTTLDLASKWSTLKGSVEAPPLVTREILSEAWLLAQQYLGNKAAPGNLLELLEITRQRLSQEAPGKGIALDDLILTLTRLTGLPAALLDERRELDTVELQKFFERRVLGQPEAVDCLVERVAMIKASVNDPTRPLGVFLFAGPTGSGKTEIGKALTEFMFGSSERMVRMDMSEFQTPESLSRIIGRNAVEEDSDALVDKIRRQPFSVVLLDEFEKAHPKVWDLFLQVFDDGRLTDRRGNAADCRHALFIMTSNVGSAIPKASPMGFRREPDSFNPGDVRNAINQTFQKEFLNRIDRVVVFRPLSRESMRKILRKELDDVFRRRGLRNRTWAFVWDDDALDFLLEKGFTVDLGARPLKRAIERYLLTPLAMTIVHNQFPAGDQFLFVKRGRGRLDVEFVDPDVPDDALVPAATGEAETGEGAEPAGLPSLLLHSRGTPAEIDHMAGHFERIGRTLQADSWKQTKEAAFELISQSEFWESPDRFSILDEVEYLDRIEAGYETAGSLLEKLRRSASAERASVPRHLAERLAQQLYLLDSACRSVLDNEPRDAFLLIESAQETTPLTRVNNEFALRVANMYREWSQKRRMKVKLLRESREGDDQPYHLLAAVSGYAAYHILAREHGLHVLEIPETEKGFLRAKVQVLVAPQPDEPAGPELKDWCSQADRAFAGLRRESLKVVRRYREEPSPLVRDGVQHWKTGRIDRVLDGDFDLFGGHAARNPTSS